MSQRTQQVYQYYLNKGVPAHLAAAMAGNMHVESGGFADDVISGKRRGDNGTAYGAAQWRGVRFANLQDYAAKRGTDWRNLNAQLDFALEEMNGKSPYADKIAAANYQKMVASNNPVQATNLFMNKYERAHPSPKMNHIDKRVAMANQLYGMPAGVATGDLSAIASASQATGNTPATAAYATSPNAETQGLGLGAVSGQLAANQAAATQVAEAAPADPFGALLQTMLASQQQTPTPVPAAAPMQPAPEIDPYQQTALTSQTPDAYRKKDEPRRRRIVI